MYHSKPLWLDYHYSGLTQSNSKQSQGHTQHSMCILIRSMYTEVHQIDQPRWDALHNMTALKFVPSEVIIYWVNAHIQLPFTDMSTKHYISTA